MEIIYTLAYFFDLTFIIHWHLEQPARAIRNHKKHYMYNPQNEAFHPVKQNVLFSGSPTIVPPIDTSLVIFLHLPLTLHEQP